jgi:hypothetical protein
VATFWVDAVAAVVVEICCINAEQVGQNANDEGVEYVEADLVFDRLEDQ